MLHEYFRDCARDFGVHDHIRFRTEVRSATWDDATATWSVVVRDPDGHDETLVANAVVSAVGQLNRPHFPEIPGLDSFAGVSFHSAQWDHDAPLDGARVAVIGTGASSVQFTPEIAPRAGQLFLFQRTPPWLGPSPDYHDAVSDGQRWLYAHVPTYSEWNRFWMFWRMGDGSHPRRARRSRVGHRRTAPSARSTTSCARCSPSYLERQFADRPDLLPHVVPTYPPGAKRLLRDNGVWAGALTRDNVTLVTDEIREITPTGIVTVDGTEYDVDVIVYGTGFQASHFLTPMRVSGRGGVDLHEQWDGDARAYLGITIPGFPNFFCLYGPNTNIVINGSIIYFSECGVRYILGCLELLLRDHHAVARRAQGRARRVQRAGRRREPHDGVGLVRREQLVQERTRPGRPELAVHAARVLAAHPRPRSRRLRRQPELPRRHACARSDPLHPASRWSTSTNPTVPVS